MAEPRRALSGLPAVAAAAAAVALASGCTSSEQAAEPRPSVTFDSGASGTPGMTGQTTSPAPASSPGKTESGVAETGPQGAPLPGAGQPIAFERNIKPLFRQSDRASMNWAFDLWSYNDVKSHAKAIMDRLRDGSMPCDGAWAPDKLDVFQRWIDSGMPA